VPFGLIQLAAPQAHAAEVASGDGLRLTISGSLSSLKGLSIVTVGFREPTEVEEAVANQDVQGAALAVVLGRGEGLLELPYGGFVLFRILKTLTFLERVADLGFLFIWEAVEIHIHRGARVRYHQRPAYELVNGGATPIPNRWTVAYHDASAHVLVASHCHSTRLSTSLLFAAARLP
jgi:hypothetical protein